MDLGFISLSLKYMIVILVFLNMEKPSGLCIKIYENELKIGNWKDGKKLCWERYWEIKDYLKSNQLKYVSILHKDIKFLICKKFI